MQSICVSWINSQRFLIEAFGFVKPACPVLCDCVLEIVGSECHRFRCRRVFNSE
jgi:hypothetical protein